MHDMKQTAHTTREAQVFSLLHAATRIEKKLDQALSCTRGISFTEYHLLKQLHSLHSSSATRVDLARAVRLTPSAVTRALKPLEKMGMVQTEKSDRDARRSMASLTDAGVDVLQDADGIVSDAIAELPQTDNSSESWLAMIDTLANH
ncbi:MAG: DNA-binding MarR family transcriptional regulator [Granulosicoccus sp.]|jgi:DNA-binding MarR family transcriptional regulator